MVRKLDTPVFRARKVIKAPARMSEVPQMLSWLARKLAERELGVDRTRKKRVWSACSLAQDQEHYKGGKDEGEHAIHAPHR